MINAAPSSTAALRAAECHGRTRRGASAPGARGVARSGSSEGVRSGSDQRSRRLSCPYVEGVTSSALACTTEPPRLPPRAPWEVPPIPVGVGWSSWRVRMGGAHHGHAGRRFRALGHALVVVRPPRYCADRARRRGGCPRWFAVDRRRRGRGGAGSHIRLAQPPRACAGSTRASTPAPVRPRLHHADVSRGHGDGRDHDQRPEQQGRHVGALIAVATDA